ncbi:hypothetical protein JCM8115_002434 [Rhodotorula mucilaginosa]
MLPFLWLSAAASALAKSPPPPPPPLVLGSSVAAAAEAVDVAAPATPAPTIPIAASDPAFSIAVWSV